LAPTDNETVLGKVYFDDPGRFEFFINSGIPFVGEAPGPLFVFTVGATEGLKLVVTPPLDGPLLPCCGDAAGADPPLDGPLLACGGTAGADPFPLQSGSLDDLVGYLFPFLELVRRLEPQLGFEVGDECDGLEVAGSDIGELGGPPFGALVGGFVTKAGTALDFFPPFLPFDFFPLEFPP
jgi:hypothetical protein